MKASFILIALFLCWALAAQIPEAPAQGTGTSNDPYQISNFGNLFWLAQTPSVWNQNFIQTAHIDAGESSLISSPEPNTAGWIPIGNGSTQFSGSYDGQGYAIYYLFLHRPTLFYTGLFGYMVGASLNRIHLRDAQIVGQVYAGILAGVANSGSVINNCTTTGTVSGTFNVGGLLGYCDGSGTTNSYSHANVFGSGDQVGGFVGMSGWNNNAYHYFCYSTGSVTAPNTGYKGGFMGRQGSTETRFSYWDIQTSGITTDPVATGKTTAEMKQQSTYDKWNFNNQWSIEENLSYPDLDDLLYHAPLTNLGLDDLYGYGTESEPYVIWGADDLFAMRLAPAAYFMLGADIDLSASVIWDLGKGWIPVGSTTTPFTGFFDGNGFSISGLTINRPKTDFQGFFGYTNNARIRRLVLEDVHIMGKANVGGVTGYAMSGSLDEISCDGIIIAYQASGGITGVLDTGSLQRCMADIDMLSYYDFAGGLVGIVTSTGSISGIVSNSGSMGSVNGQYNVGGIVGMLSWGYVQNCYSHTSVSGNHQVGGIVGTQGWSNPGFVMRCFATGAVSLAPGGQYSGGVVARLAAGRVEECYWDTQTSGIISSPHAGTVGKTSAEMKHQSTFKHWSFNALWQIEEGISYPTHKDLSLYALPLVLTTDNLYGWGTQSDPYVIWTLDELNVMRQAPNAYYYIQNDLDLSATCVWNGGMGWEPVGTNSTPFTGIFDGAGNILSNLSIERPNSDYIGLFGYISGSKISDLTLSDVNIHAKDYLGAVTGHALDSRIDMIDFQGCISGHNYLGSIAGTINRSVIQRCQAEAANWGAYSSVGGIVGAVDSDASFNSTVSTCETSGWVRAQYNVGGIVGFLGFGALINSASHTSIQAYTHGGGVVGTLGWGEAGSIARCFATGQITAEPGGWNVSGFVGRLQYGTVYECYWDTQSSGSSTGYVNNQITGLDTAGMKLQASYQNWNFDTLWQITEGTDYPRLRDLSAYQDPTPVALVDMWGSGTVADPYLIQNLDHLFSINQDLDAYYLLDADLDLTASLIWNGGRGWLPVGTASQPFTGILDGAGHTLSNLNIIAPRTNNVGIIGTAQNAMIGDLKLVKMSILAEDFVSGVCATAIDCEMGDIRVQGTLSGNNYIGGVLARQQGGYLHRAASEVTVRGRGYAQGGILGSAQSAAQISECRSSGSVRGTQLVGGLVGELFSGTLSDSYSRAAVHSYTSVGGAVGRVGWNDPGHLVNCYSTGAVTLEPGAYDAGGFVGQLSYGTYTMCFWDTSTSGMTSNSGSVGVQGLITQDMIYPASIDTFSDWDFPTTWMHDVQGLQNSGYPYLAWMDLPVPDAVQNLDIIVSDDQFQLLWQPVAGVSNYRIYASEDPQAPWNQWVYIGQSSDTSFIVSGGNKRFFIVRSHQE